MMGTESVGYHEHSVLERKRSSIDDAFAAARERQVANSPKPEQSRQPKSKWARQIPKST